MARLPEQYLHTWKGMGGPGDPLGVPWWVMVVGIGRAPLRPTGAPISCLCSAPWRPRICRRRERRRSWPQSLSAFPAIVTVRGMLALAVAPAIVKHDYNLALPTLMGRYYHSGMLGLGLTALLASFMSGMAETLRLQHGFQATHHQIYFVKNRPDSDYRG